MVNYIIVHLSKKNYRGYYDKFLTFQEVDGEYLYKKQGWTVRTNQNNISTRHSDFNKLDYELKIICLKKGQENLELYKDGELFVKIFTKNSQSVMKHYKNRVANVIPCEIKYSAYIEITPSQNLELF